MNNNRSKEHLEEKHPIVPSHAVLVPTAELTPDLPHLVATAGNAARFAYEEFFLGRIRNPYTRRNYRHAVHRFLEWCQSHGLQLLPTD